MKELILTIIFLLFTTSNLVALTINATVKRNTIYTKPTMVQRSFGKLHSTGEYGIFVYVAARSEDGERSLETFFFRLNCTVEKEDNFLQAIIDGKEIILAEKKWYGWKRTDGVIIKHSIEGSPYSTIDAWVEIEEALLNQ